MKPEIEHVIVLMMENRSFDHMLGFLDHEAPGYERLTENQYTNRKSPSSRPRGVTNHARHTINDRRGKHVGPSHTHRSVMQQLFGNETKGKRWRPTPPAQGQPWPEAKNAGFIRNYHKVKNPSGGDVGRVMDCFAEDLVPVISSLARQYTVCTRWFCSVPGQTWPNRDYALSGSSRGEVDIRFRGLHPLAKTIFEAVDEVDRTWKVYHQDTPHAAVYQPLHSLGRRFCSHESLLRDIEFHNRWHKGRMHRLPNLAWVEPDYGLGPGATGNSQHPDQAGRKDEFLSGEAFIARIHNKMLATMDQCSDPAQSLFAKTVFLLTYDEHGGFFDHVPPPSTVAPDDKFYSPWCFKWFYQFRFDLLGPRVPAIVISPWVKKNVLLTETFDHSSISATLHNVFGAEPLLARAAQANAFWPADGAAPHICTSGLRTDLVAVPEYKGPEHQASVRAAKAAAPSSPSQLTGLQQLHMHLTKKLNKTLQQDADAMATESTVSPRRTLFRRQPAPDVFDVVRRLRKAGGRIVEISVAGGATYTEVGGKPHPKAKFDELWAKGAIELIDDEGRCLKIEPTGLPGQIADATYWNRAEFPMRWRELDKGIVAEMFHDFCRDELDSLASKASGSAPEF